MLTAILTHRLKSEIPKSHRNVAIEERQKAAAPLWEFDELETIRRNLVRRAGRLTETQDTLTFTMSANTNVR